MIINTPPSIKQIIREIWKPLSFLFVWDVVVTVSYLILPYSAPSLPMTLFGSTLALLLGFRSNSAYQRWWEGRGLWGLMINASRSLARQVDNFLPDTDEARDLKRKVVLRQIAYVNALRCQLRGQKPDSEVLRFLDESDALVVLACSNVANGIVHGTGQLISSAHQKGWIDTIQQARLESTLVDIANAQGGMERLKNTPLPNQYRLLPTTFTHMFCMLLPIGLVETLGVATPLGTTVANMMFLAALAIGDDLVNPFANTVHDVPLSAMCRTVEIDLLQTLGEPAPEPAIADRDGVLW